MNQGAPQEPDKFPFILVGNKIDRETDREVEEESVNEFLAKHPKIVHLQTSAKNREGIEVAFEKIALASVENKQEVMYQPSYSASSLWKCPLKSSPRRRTPKTKRSAADSQHNLIAYSTQTKLKNHHLHR